MALPTIGGAQTLLNQQLSAVQSGFMDGLRSAAGIAISTGVFNQVRDVTAPVVYRTNGTAGWVYDQLIEGLKLYSAVRIGTVGTIL